MLLPPKLPLQFDLGALQPFALYEAGPAEDRAREVATAYGLPYVIRQEAGPDRAVAGTTSAASGQCRC